MHRAEIRIENINTQDVNRLNALLRMTLHDYDEGDEYGNWFEEYDGKIAELLTWWKYWGPESLIGGPWINIAGVLQMALMTPGTIVRYGTTAQRYTGLPIMTTSRLTDYWKAFYKQGETK